MLGSVCKKLRRLAREATKGKLDRQLMHHRTIRGTAINNPATTRGVYRYLKNNIHAVRVQVKGGNHVAS